MLLSLVLATLSLDAHAESMEAADICMPYVNLALPSGLHDVDVPPDAAIPIQVRSECGANGVVEVRLHRSVDGAAAEQVLLETRHMDDGESAVFVLVADQPLLDDTEYLVVSESNFDSSQVRFHTGSADALGMDEGVPLVEVTEAYAQELYDHRYHTTAYLSIDAVPDPDALSIIEVYDADNPSTALQTHLPGTRDTPIEIGFAHVRNGDGPACYFIVQTDGLGQSEASAESCILPELHTADDSDDQGAIGVGGNACSTVGALPAIGSSILAMLFGLRRRRE